MTIGDVLAVVGIVAGICLSLWVMLIGAALLFDTKAQAARAVWEDHSGKAFGMGLLLLATLGFGAIALINGPGVLKFLGFLLLLILLATSLLGGAGLALLLSERTSAHDVHLSPLTALGRGAGLMALAWLFPVLGWFLVAPVCVVVGLGAGARVVWKRREKPLPPLVSPAAPLALAGDESCESPGAIG